jgi:oligopeptide transport system ATP-binding protein
MTPLLKVRDVQVTFDVPKRGAWPWTPPNKLRAVQNVSFDLNAGETLGIVGESGSGKSTLARAIVGTVPASGGQVLWQGKDLLTLTGDARRTQRRDVQMIFQDPLAALNPRMPVGEIIAEPLVTHQPDLPKSEVKARVRDIMDRVGLLSNQLNRYPHEFSGGQCQRIGIARALIMKPKLVVCDEPVSALDVSIQAQVVNLLADLQRDMGLSLIFIAHDLSVVKHISDRIMVMYLGRQMEIAEARDLIRQPKHPYTKALIASVPIPDPITEKARPRVVLEGDLPSPLRPPSGCAFRTRCPIARPDCAKDVPPLAVVSATHQVACMYWNTQ